MRRRLVTTAASVAPRAPPLRAASVAGLRALLEDAAAPLVVLSGAGLSTESGIPDYRSPGRGEYKPITYQEFTGSHARRQRYWARSAVGYERVRRARPNASHEALRRLEEAGLVSLLVTQNVDSLHGRAGHRDVVELHGSLREVVCQGCGHREDRDTMQRWLEEDNPAFTAAGGWARQPAVAPGLESPSRGALARPDGDVELDEEAYEHFQVRDCPSCGGILKPDVVFFGEAVPRPRVDRAMEAVERSGGILCVGTSLEVWSGLRFPRRAHKLGLPVGIVSVGPTRADGIASYRAHASVGELLGIVARGLARQ